MNLQEQLRRDEGLRLKPYRDTVGKLTIGVGRNLDDVGISEEEASLMLFYDIRRAEASLKKALPWVAGMDEIRRAALINLTFNVGIARLLGFKNMLVACQAKNWPGAAAELLDSVYAKQVGDRAKRLAEQLLTGVWQ